MLVLHLIRATDLGMCCKHLGPALAQGASGARPETAAWVAAFGAGAGDDPAAQVPAALGEGDGAGSGAASIASQVCERCRRRWWSVATQRGGFFCLLHRALCSALTDRPSTIGLPAAFSH